MTGESSAPLTHDRARFPIGFAHRGAPRGRSEQNTISAFRRALDLGAPGLESDVALTADGVPVLAHPRVGLRRGPSIGTVRRSELPPSIPALDDVYEHCGTEFELALDMAQPLAAEAVVETARVLRAENRLWLTYWRLPTLLRWRELLPDVHLVYATMPIRGQGPDFDALGRAGIDAVNVLHVLCTHRMVALAQARGLKVFAWGIRGTRSLERVLRHGVDGVFCDDVPGMVKTLADP